VWWLVVSGLLILPTVMTPVSALRRRLAHRRARNQEAKGVVLRVDGRSPRRTAKPAGEETPAPSPR
jgi:hypothetical protein